MKSPSSASQVTSSPRRVVYLNTSQMIETIYCQLIVNLLYMSCYCLQVPHRVRCKMRLPRQWPTVVLTRTPDRSDNSNCLTQQRLNFNAHAQGRASRLKASCCRESTCLVRVAPRDWPGRSQKGRCIAYKRAQIRFKLHTQITTH